MCATIDPSASNPGLNGMDTLSPVSSHSNHPPKCHPSIHNLTEVGSQPESRAPCLSECISPEPFEYKRPSFRGLSPFLEENETYKKFLDDFLKKPTGFLVEPISKTSNPVPSGLVPRNKEGYTDIVEAMGIQVFRFSLVNHGKTVVDVRTKFVRVFRNFRKKPKSENHSVYFVITSPFHFRMDVPCLWEYTSGGRLIKEQHPVCQKDWKYVPKVQDDEHSDDDDSDVGDSDDEEPAELEHRNKYRFNPVFLSLSDEAMRNPIRQTIYYWDNRVKPEVPAEVVIEYKFVQKRRRKSSKSTGSV